MPISVPKWAKEELEFAWTVARRAGYAAASRDMYIAIRNHLASKNVDSRVHNDTSTVPSDHVYIRP